MLFRRTEPATSSAAFSTYLWGWITSFYGFAIWIGGGVRFNAAAYYALNRLPGGYLLVAFSFMALGAWSLVGQRYGNLVVRNVAMWSSVVGYFAMVGTFVYSAIHSPVAGLGGIVIFSGVALQLMVLIRLRPRRITDDAPNR